MISCGNEINVTTLFHKKESRQFPVVFVLFLPIDLRLYILKTDK